MRTLQTIGELAGRTVGLWWQFLTPLIVWCSLGFAVHELAFFLSARLGAAHQTPATLVFILGVVAMVCSYVLMIHSTVPGLRLTRPQTAQHPVAQALPGELFDAQSGVGSVARALGPFLAVYAVWGLVDSEVTDLFSINILYNGLGGVDQWSINLSRFWFYLTLAVVAWVVRIALDQLRRRVQWAWLEFLAMAVEGIWVFASFITALTVVDAVVAWLTTRVAWAWLLGLWRNALAALPDLAMPWGLTLPASIDRFVGWLISDVLPAVGEHVVLPLMWLALAATVFGWYRFTSADVLAGTRIGTGLQRLGERLPSGRVRAVSIWATGDLRIKYLPVLQALRLLLHSGPRVLGAFILLSTVIDVGTEWLMVGVARILGPLPYDLALGVEPTVRLITTLIEMPLLVALYAAAFERVIRAVR
ncbi:hypothetical protein ACQBAR_11330 [Propionibacteriaceae bacterium Y1685]